MAELEAQLKMEKKRGFIVKEIISTEVTYVDRLKFLVEVVVRPLRESNLLDVTDQNNQFSILEKIYELHSKNSFTELETKPERFGELFDNICNNNQIYADYLVQYEEAMARRCSLLLSNRKFSDFLDKAEKDPRLQNQKIESIFILPVQRIPRYRLLLEQLQKCTPEDHPQYQMVNTALENVCAMAMYSNEQIRKRENRAKIMDIVKSIEPTTRVDLLAEQDRAFIKEGTLLRQCRRGLKEFQFWLFNDQLLYGQPTPLGLYILNRQIPLSKCFVSPCESMHEGGYSFIVESPAKSFIVCVSNEAEKDEWVDAIKGAILTLSQQRMSKNKDDKRSIAPLWIPDSGASTCQKCHMGFSLINRRHHCRNCGAIVCDSCSKRRYKLEHVDQRKQVRVCDGCYAYLSKEGASSIRLNSMRIKSGGITAGLAELENDDEYHDSDEEMDLEMRERRNLDEDDYYSYDPSEENELQSQLAQSDSAIVFRVGAGGSDTGTSSMLQKMGKTISDAISNSPTVLRARFAAGLDSPSSASTSTTATPAATPVVASGSGKVGSSSSGYMSFSNPLSGGAAAAGGTGLPTPPPKPSRPPSNAPATGGNSSAQPPSPMTPTSDTGSSGSSGASAAPPMRRILRSASAFVTTSSAFLGNASNAIGLTSSSSEKAQARASFEEPAAASPTPRPAINVVETVVPDDVQAAPVPEQATSSGGTFRSGGPTPPAKPPKPAKMNRRTNVCITVNQEDLAQAAAEEERASSLRASWSGTNHDDYANTAATDVASDQS